MNCRMNLRDMGDDGGESDLFNKGRPPAVILCYLVVLCAITKFSLNLFLLVNPSW